MATNPEMDKLPLTFDLPDGDVVELCTWPYVLYRLNDLINPLTECIIAENRSLDVINNKLIEWGPDENAEEEP